MLPSTHPDLLTSHPLILHSFLLDNKHSGTPFISEHHPSRESMHVQPFRLAQVQPPKGGFRGCRVSCYRVKVAETRHVLTSQPSAESITLEVEDNVILEDGCC